MAVKTVTWTDYGSYAIGTVTLAANDTTSVQVGAGVKRVHWLTSAGTTTAQLVNSEGSAGVNLSATGAYGAGSSTAAGFIGEGYVPARWWLEQTSATGNIEIFAVHA